MRSLFQTNARSYAKFLYVTLFLFFCFQHKLKSSQKDKVRQFINFTQTGEKTALTCLTAHEWKLDIAVDNYFQFPERYNRDQRSNVDKKRIEQLFIRYKGEY